MAITKTRNTMRMLAALLAFALAIALSLGGLMTAFADEVTPAEAAITKVLETPVGTTLTTGGIEYSFNVERVSYNTQAYDAEDFNDTDFPKLGDEGVITITIGDNDSGRTSTEENVTTIYDEADLIDETTFTAAGEYIYMITEEGESSLTEDLTSDENEAFSAAEYQVTVIVAWDDEGEDYYVSHITAIRQNGDDGVEVDDEAEYDGVKVDPTPGGDGESYYYSQMYFTNAFWKANSGDPDPEGENALKPFAVSKTVEGDYSDPNKYFDFTIDLSVPGILDLDPTIKAYVYEDSSQITPTEDNTDAEITDYSFPFADGDTVSLKHGQTLKLTGLPVGTGFVVTEAGTPAYVPSAEVTTNGGVALEINDTEAGDSLATAYTNMGEANDNKVDFTNENVTTAPTGINMDNLPYYALILLAAAALAVYIAVKSRRRRSRG